MVTQKDDRTDALGVEYTLYVTVYIITPKWDVAESLTEGSFHARSLSMIQRAKADSKHNTTT